MWLSRFGIGLSDRVCTMIPNGPEAEAAKLGREKASGMKASGTFAGEITKNAMKESERLVLASFILKYYKKKTEASKEPQD